MPVSSIVLDSLTGKFQYPSVPKTYPEGLGFLTAVKHCFLEICKFMIVVCDKFAASQGPKQ